MLTPSSRSRAGTACAVAMMMLIGACRAAGEDDSGQASNRPGASDPPSATAPVQGGTMICNHYDASPIPAGYDSNGCWVPSEYFERGDEVIPPVEATAPTLRIEASGTAPMGMEGTLFFVRVTSPTSQIVLEREWQWPSVEQQIPPGAYQVTAWARTCDGNCDLLDPSTLSCTVDLLAEPSFMYTMTYAVSDDWEVSCDVPHLGE